MNKEWQYITADDIINSVPGITVLVLLTVP